MPKAATKTEVTLETLPSVSEQADYKIETGKLQELKQRLSENHRQLAVLESQKSNLQSDVQAVMNGQPLPEIQGTSAEAFKRNAREREALEKAIEQQTRIVEETRLNLTRDLPENLRKEHAGIVLDMQAALEQACQLFEAEKAFRSTLTKKGYRSDTLPCNLERTELQRFFMHGGLMRSIARMIDAARLTEIAE